MGWGRVGWVEFQGGELGEIRRRGTFEGVESCVMGWDGMRIVVHRVGFCSVFAAVAAEYIPFFFLHAPVSFFFLFLFHAFLLMFFAFLFPFFYFCLSMLLRAGPSDEEMAKVTADMRKEIERAMGAARSAPPADAVVGFVASLCACLVLHGFGQSGPALNENWEQVRGGVLCAIVVVIRSTYCRSFVWYFGVQYYDGCALRGQR